MDIVNYTRMTVAAVANPCFHEENPSTSGWLLDFVLHPCTVCCGVSGKIRMQRNDKDHVADLTMDNGKRSAGFRRRNTHL